MYMVAKNLVDGFMKNASRIIAKPFFFFFYCYFFLFFGHRRYGLTQSPRALRKVIDAKFFHYNNIFYAARAGVYEKSLRFRRRTPMALALGRRARDSPITYVRAVPFFCFFSKVESKTN